MSAFLSNPHFIEVVIALLIAVTALVKAQTAKVKAETASKDANKATAKADFVQSKMYEHDIAIKEVQKQ
jgi:hypothetical protein